MRLIKTIRRLIIMGKVVPSLIPLQMRSFLVMTEIILSLWEGKELLKLKIKLGIFFRFQTARSMKLRRTSCIMRFFR